uniref:Putative lipocalin-3 1 n=1 Tax=Amblyomma parvum TaxID=251391 RepID=A0A023G0N3_AMBPA
MYFILAFAFLVPSALAISEESDSGDVPTLRDLTDSTYGNEEGEVPIDVPRMSDLLVFLNSTDKIWMYLRTKDDETSCISNKEISLTRYTYTFTREYTQNQRKYTTTLTAALSKGGKEGPVMSINYGQTTVVYTVRNIHVNENCAVLTFTEKGKTECELYLWENKVDDTTPRACEKVYDKLCVGKYMPYNYWCKYQR